MATPKTMEVAKKAVFLAMRFTRLDKFRREIPDPTPMAPPIGYKKQPSMQELIRDMIKNERIASELASAGVETFEEADDFEIPDDPVDPSTPYEADFEGDALQALQAIDDEHNATPKIVHMGREYGSVEEFVAANPEFASPPSPSQTQLRPEPTPHREGVGEDVIAPGETPLPPARASATSTMMGFLRRG